MRQFGLGSEHIGLVDYSVVADRDLQHFYNFVRYIEAIFCLT